MAPAPPPPPAASSPVEGASPNTKPGPSVNSVRTGPSLEIEASLCPLPNSEPGLPQPPSPRAKTSHTAAEIGKSADHLTISTFYHDSHITVFEWQAFMPLHDSAFTSGKWQKR